MSEEVSIQIVDPGTEDDPFSAGAADPLASTDAGINLVVEDGADPQEDVQGAGDGEDADSQDDGQQAIAEEDLEYTDEELIALEELQRFADEQAAERESRLQSRYDRQFAAQNRQIRELAEASRAREQELTARIREAELNGLDEATQERLKQQWAYDDEKAKLDAYGNQLSEYHVELLRTAYATEYAEFGLTAEDLEDFDTPEAMEEFIKDVQIEYYKLMADPAVQATLSAAEWQDSAPAAAKPAARKAPAGVSAPSDAGGGGAPPPASKFNTGTGAAAMAENIRSGWETPRAR